jgi:hypothetical protein
MAVPSRCRSQNVEECSRILCMATITSASRPATQPGGIEPQSPLRVQNIRINSITVGKRMRPLGARAPQIRQNLMDRSSVILILDPVQRCLVEIDGMSCAAEASNCASPVVNVPLPQRRSHQDRGRPPFNLEPGP